VSINCVIAHQSGLAILDQHAVVDATIDQNRAVWPGDFVFIVVVIDIVQLVSRRREMRTAVCLKLAIHHVARHHGGAEWHWDAAHFLEIPGYYLRGHPPVVTDYPVFDHGVTKFRVQRPYDSRHLSPQYAYVQQSFVLPLNFGVVE
jgi:hypothetical protein